MITPSCLNCYESINCINSCGGLVREPDCRVSRGRGGRARGDLETDRQPLLALVKDIEIVGEAAAQVTESARAQAPAIPWPEIVAMRNRLVHAYFSINLDIVWQTVQQDLPTLIAHLERVVDPEM